MSEVTKALHAPHCNALPGDGSLTGYGNWMFLMGLEAGT